MRSAVRAIGVILGAALAADRRGVVVTLVLGLIAWLSVPIQAIAIKLFIDAGVALDAGRMAVSTILLGVILGGIWYVNSLRQFVSYTLGERTHHEVDQRLQALVGEIEGVEHLERPDYLDRVSMLQAQSHQFGNVDDIIDLPALVLYLVLTGLLLFTLDPILVLVPLAIIPALYFNGRSERALRAADEAGAPHRRLARRMLELATDPSAAGEARLFEAGLEIAQRHEAASRQYDVVLDRGRRRQLAFTIVGWTLYSVAFVLAFVVVVPEVRSGRLGVGDLFLMFYLVRGMTWQAEWTLWSITYIRRTLTATANYLWLSDYAASVARRPERGTAPPVGILRFDRVSFRYPGTNREVLSDVTFEVPAGSTLALVGDNGAGKTTLVKLLARFYEPTGGRITIDGVDLATVDIRAWRETLSACLQDFSRFEFLARETVGVGSLATIGDTTRVTRAVVAAGAEDVVQGLEDGLETQLGTAWEGGAELSTGEWQKLALGRGMMRDQPRLLLLDEPTAALDAGAEARLFERYAAASEFASQTGSITIIVSHRMSTVRMADVIAVIEGGKLRQYGTHADLVNVDGPYRELYETQAAAYAS